LIDLAIHQHLYDTAENVQFWLENYPLYRVTMEPKDTKAHHETGEPHSKAIHGWLATDLEDQVRNRVRNPATSTTEIQLPYLTYEHHGASQRSKENHRAATKDSMEHTAASAVDQDSMEHTAASAVDQDSMEHTTASAVVQDSMEHTAASAVDQDSMEHTAASAVVQDSMEHTAANAVVQDSMEHTVASAIVDNTVGQGLTTGEVLDMLEDGDQSHLDTRPAAAFYNEIEYGHVAKAPETEDLDQDLPELEIEDQGQDFEHDDQPVTHNPAVTMASKTGASATQTGGETSNSGEGHGGGKREKDNGSAQDRKEGDEEMEPAGNEGHGNGGDDGRE
jgi:hypothetical protein